MSPSSTKVSREAFAHERQLEIARPIDFRARGRLKVRKAAPADMVGALQGMGIEVVQHA